MFYVWIDNPDSASLPIDFEKVADRINGFKPNTASSAANVNAGLRQANLVSVALMEALGLNTSTSTYNYKSSVLTLKTAITNAILGIKVNNAGTADIALSTRDAGTQANDPSGIAKVFTFANTNGFGTKVGNGYWKLWDLQDGSTTYCGLIPSLDKKQLLGNSSYRMKEVWSSRFCGQGASLTISHSSGTDTVNLTSTNDGQSVAGIYLCSFTWSNKCVTIVAAITDESKYGSYPVTLDKGTETHPTLYLRYNPNQKIFSWTGDGTYTFTTCNKIFSFR